MQLNDYSPDYFEKAFRSPLQRAWHIKRLKMVKKVLNRSSWGTVLDAGCDGGSFIKRLESLTSLEFVGLDIHLEAIKYANSRIKRSHFILGDVLHLPFRSLSFDYVMCLEVLEHVDMPLVALKELHRCLKLGGTCIISVPNSESKLFKLIWKFWVSTFGKVWKGLHVQEFSYKDLKKLIIKSGFKVFCGRRTHLGMMLFFNLTKLTN